MLRENEAKIKWLYEGEMATLGLHQMGNEMKKVGNRCGNRMLCALRCWNIKIDDQFLTGYYPSITGYKKNRVSQP